MKVWLQRNVLLVVFVVLPTLLAALYFGLIASDIYTSESRFLVRSPQKQSAPSGLGSLLLSGGLSHSGDDTYAVRDYILSRDALKELEAKLKVTQIFANGRIDIFDRFAGLPGVGKSFEQLYLYYGKHVSVEYDAQSSITTLTVRAYSAKDAYDINSLLIDISERLVNTLNDRSRHDLISFADKEVQLASDKAKAASIALFSYRTNQAIFEPDRQAALQLEGVAKIQQELVSTEAEIAQVKKLSPDNPQIRSLETRAESLRAAIASEASKVTSAHGSFSARAPEFERLTLDVDFADKQLGAALAALESARSEAQQKQLYLERLVQPSLPDKAMSPKRMRSVFTVFLISLIAWGVASLLAASIREHAD